MNRQNPTWSCKVGFIGECNLRPGADLPMRKAVEAAFEQVTGVEAQFNFSGWGASLDEQELAVVENRLPSDEHRKEWFAREAGPELLAALKGVVGVIAVHATLEAYQKVAVALAKAEPSQAQS